MFNSRSAALLLALLVAAGAAAAQGKASYPGIGRAATPEEVAAWDIDVRPDFKGLPAGAGSVARGQEVWESKCASCHGVFGESNEVFNPLVGGTTAEDVKTGRVASLRPGGYGYPGRTTLMKVAHVSTLWDYINRAMPWTQPKSLSVEEVYAATAYLLHLGGVLPADFTLSDKNIRDVQQRMPNRNGMTAAHALWPGKEFSGAGKPDVAAQACMKDCPVETTVASTLPAFARNAHGNLAEQNRAVGAQRGVDTTAPAQHSPAPVMKLPDPSSAGPAKAVQALAQKNNCTACHAPDRKLVGPSWSDIAVKHQGKADYLTGKIRTGGSGTWGAIPMPPQALSEADARTLASWLAGGAKP
jgi:S-disulfanyl-L-cysteine oxidoreductase SoxD